MKRALFSLYDQNGAVLFARELARLGWQIITTSETFGLLKKNGVNAIDIYDFLGVTEKYPFPPTLHPKIELALTTDKWKKIDLVYDTTYPVTKGIDVGGHTLLALAAKGRRIVASSNEDMKKIITELKENDMISEKLRSALIENTYNKIACFYNSLAEGPADIPISSTLLKNGENPYQVPAYFLQIDKRDKLALGNFKQVAGESPCFTNMADFDAILHIMCAVAEAFNKKYGKRPFITIAAKHGNPCGLSVSWKSESVALENALWGNPLAVWGGEVITNFHITARLGKILKESAKRGQMYENPNWMLDVIAAPSFDTGAIAALSKNSKRKILTNPSLKKPFFGSMQWQDRHVRGGVLHQPPNNYVVAFGEFSAPDSIIDSLIIAWASAYFSFHGGNEVAIAKSGSLVSTGGGPSTLSAAKTAVARAKESGYNIEGSCFAADAFFPFTDAAEVLAKAGCKYGLVPAGGKNFEEVRSFFHKNKIKMLYVPEQYRGFCRH